MKQLTRRTLLAAAPALAFGGPLLATRPVRAAKQYGPGVTDTEIKIGNTCFYSGPASSYGTIGRAMAAYYKMINDEGGVNGRKIDFISYDDAYSPPKTVEMTRKLVEEDKVFLDAGPLGTPTNSAIWHYMNEHKVPQLFVSTGATKWDDPKGHPWTIGWQPNYQSEGRIYAAYILQNKPDGKIGVLYQDDDFGKDYLKGLTEGLGDKAKSMIVVAVSYETTDPTVDSQILSMRAAGCDVFVNTAIPKFAAQSIKKAAEIEWKPLHILSSIGNSVAATLKPAGLEFAKDIVAKRRRLQMVGRLHGQVLSGGRQDRRRQRLWPLQRGDDRAGVEAMRRRADPRKRNETGRKPA
jgi:branched-chain amino acid transport system substrate-binding protein